MSEKTYDESDDLALEARLRDTIPSERASDASVFAHVQRYVEGRAARQAPISRRLLAFAAIALPAAAAVALGVAIVNGNLLKANNPVPAGASSPSPSPSIDVCARYGRCPPSPGTSAPSFSALRMFAPSGAGWALEGEPHPPYSGYFASVIRTEDLGNHWKRVRVANSTGLSIVAASFFSPTTAWVLEEDGGYQTSSHFVAQIARTTDGARTWQTLGRLEAGGTAVSVQFVDPTHGWVFAMPSAGGADGAQDTTLLRTTDGGATWNVAAYNRRGTSSQLPDACAAAYPTYIGPPLFTDAKDGWLGGQCNHPLLHVTHDGGVTWSERSLPPFPGPAVPSIVFDVHSIQFPSVSEGHLVLDSASSQNTAAEVHSAFYTTRDGGGSWVATRLPASAAASTFLDLQHGWMIGSGSAGFDTIKSLYATADSGRSWRLLLGPIDLSTDTGARYKYLAANEMDFVGPKLGFIPVVDRLFMTRDGGATWADIHASFPWTSPSP